MGRLSPDLDVVITDSIDALFEHPGEFHHS